MPPLASDDVDDNADLGCIIGPEDFVNKPNEEERALAEALAKTAAEAAAQQQAEEAERAAALRAVEAFQEREAARAQRLAETARVLIPLGRLYYVAGSAQCRSPAPPGVGRRYRPV
jgi:hypothetical protein